MSDTERLKQAHWSRLIGEGYDFIKQKANGAEAAIRSLFATAGNPGLLGQAPAPANFVTSGSVAASGNFLNSLFATPGNPGLLGAAPPLQKTFAGLAQAGRMAIDVISMIGHNFGLAGRAAVDFGRIAVDALRDLAKEGADKAAIATASLASGFAAGIGLLVTGIISGIQRARAYTRAYYDELEDLQEQIAAIGGTVFDSIKLSLKELTGIEGVESLIEKVESAAERYGLAIDSLGVKFQQLKANSMFEQLFEDWTMFADVGANINDVMAAMAPKVTAMLDQARAFGLKVPEYLKPMLEAMAGGGLIDLSGITFDPSIVSSIERVEDVLLKQLAVLERIAPPVRDIPAVNYHIPRGGFLPAIGNGGGSSGGGHTTITINALDAASFQDFLGRNGNDLAVARVVTDVARQFSYG